MLDLYDHLLFLVRFYIINLCISLIDPFESLLMLHFSICSNIFYILIHCLFIIIFILLLLFYYHMMNHNESLILLYHLSSMLLTLNFYNIIFYPLSFILQVTSLFSSFSSTISIIIYPSNPFLSALSVLFAPSSTYYLYS